MRAGIRTGIRNGIRNGTRIGMGALALGAALWLAAAPEPAFAQRRVEVYKVKYRTAEDLSGIVGTVLAGRGSVAVDRGTNSLVLIGDPAAVSDALDLLATQDRRLRSVVIHYDSKRVSDLEAQGFDVRWNVQAGDFRIGNVRRPQGSGSSVAVRAEDVDRRRSDDLSGLVRVVEGETGRIETGQTVPYRTSNGYYGTNTQFVTAASGFEARARILGDGRVQVDLAPFAGRFVGGGRIEQGSASTVVTVTPGETVVVGGLTQSGSESRLDIPSGAGSSRRSDDTVLVLRVDVE